MDTPFSLKNQAKNKPKNLGNTERQKDLFFLFSHRKDMIKKEK
jgi:hypothetical protein